MDDLGITVYALIFVVLISLFSGFFVISGENAGELNDDFSSYDSPYTPYVGSKDVKYNETGVPIVNGSTVPPGQDEGTYLVGAVILVASLIALPFTFGGSAIVTAGVIGGIITGGYMFSVGLGGNQVFSGIPIIGNIFDGLNYVATAMGSFGALASFNSNMFTLIPGGWLISAMIILPIGFIFFILVIKIIRGN